MGESSNEDPVERRRVEKDRRIDSDDRRGTGRVETEAESRRQEKDRRKD